MINHHVYFLTFEHVFLSGREGVMLCGCSELCGLWMYPVLASGRCGLEREFDNMA